MAGTINGYGHKNIISSKTGKKVIISPDFRRLYLIYGYAPAKLHAG
jgi:hypothetical protein